MHLIIYLSKILVKSIKYKNIKIFIISNKNTHLVDNLLQQINKSIN